MATELERQRQIESAMAVLDSFGCRRTVDCTCDMCSESRRERFEPVQTPKPKLKPASKPETRQRTLF